MAAYINMAALGATAFSSAALGSLDSVAHPLEPGEYNGEVWRGDVRLGSFILEIAEQGDGTQIDVDLCMIGSSHATRTARFASGAIEGHPVYAAFHCDHGLTGFHVLLYCRSRGALAFDSRSLQPGDYYILTPVRPGTWNMKTGKTGVGQILVNAPKPAQAPRASAAGAMIKVDDEGPSPCQVEIVAGDGVAFEIGGRDVAIKVELEDQTGTFSQGRRPVGHRVAGKAGRTSGNSGGTSAG